jgi:hypothetical protein
MTQVLANTFETYESVGIREDLADVIYDISPTDTPFISNIGSGPSKGTYHEFQQDELQPAEDRPASEGAEASVRERLPTIRLGNYTQIATDAARVSGTDLVADNAGRGDEMAYQMAKVGLELRNSMELTLIGTNKPYVAGTAETGGTGEVARELAPVLAWLHTNTIQGTGDGTEPTGDGSDARIDGTVAAMAEDDIVTGMENCWKEGAQPSILMTGSALKRGITKMTGNASKYKEVDDKKIVNAVDVYVTDFGDLAIVLNRYMRPIDALLMTPDSWALATHRNFMNWDLAKTGDSEAKQILTEYTLEARQEKANALLTDMSVYIPA